MKTYDYTAEELLIDTVLCLRYDEVLADNYDLFKSMDGNTEITAKTRITVDGESSTIKESISEEVWSMIVLMYGDYGIDPKTGWIQNMEGFMDMIEYLYEKQLNRG